MIINWKLIFDILNPSAEYCQTSNISHTLVGNKVQKIVGNKVVDHSDVVGALSVGAAPNYIFILDLTPGCNGLSKDNCKMKGETFKFWDLVHLILDAWWYNVCIITNSWLKPAGCQNSSFDTITLWFLCSQVILNEDAVKSSQVPP